MAVTTVKWKVDADGDWGTASNWSSNALPNSNNAVVVNTTDVHTVTFSSGTTTVASLSVGARDHFVLSGGNLNVLAAANFADGFTQTGGQISAAKVGITGPGTLTGGASTGNTAFTISGAIALANYTFAGASTLSNKTTVNETGFITVGDQTGIDATITNTATGTYKIAGDFNINGGAASARFVNAGVFDKTDGNGTSVVGVNFSNTGTVESDHGLVEFNGPANTIGGKLSGTGEIGFGSNSIAQFSAGTVTVSKLGLFDSATLNLKTDLSFDGNLDNRTNGTTTINIGASTLALGADSVSQMLGSSGAAIITGKGAFTNAGTLTLSNMLVGGNVKVSNTGTIDQTGTVTIADGNGGRPSFTNAKGAVYNFAGDSDLNQNNAAVLFTNNGTLEKTAGTGTNNVRVDVDNAGTIQVARGAIAFDGALDNSGTIAGRGTVVINGATTLETTSKLLVANFDLFGASSLTVNGALQYAGVFDDVSNGSNNLILSTAASKLTLTGGSNTMQGAFGAANVSGAGILVNQGTLAIGNATINNTASLQNNGTVNQTSTVQIGGNDGHVAAIVNEAGKVWNFSGAQLLSGGTATGSHFDNHGTVNVTAGTGAADIDVRFSNFGDGTINIATGALDISNVLLNAGTIKGNDLVLTTGSQTTLNSGTVLSVGQIDVIGSAVVTLGANLSYAGKFNDTSNGTSTIDLGAHNLTLTGASTFSAAFGSDILTGTGTLKIAHASTFNGGNIILGDTLNLDIAGNVTAVSTLQIGDISSNAASATLEAGKIYNLTTDTGLTHGTSDASVFTNNGTFEKTAGNGTSEVTVNFVNNGTITVTSGTLEFDAGTLTNNGTINGNFHEDPNTHVITITAAAPHSPHADALVFADHAAPSHDYAAPATLHGQDLDTLLAHIAHDAMI